MDLLDRVEAPGRDLLARVDDILLAGGAPPDHQIWGLLRQFGALPRDVFEAFCAMRPEPLESAGAAVRRQAETCAEERADLDAAVAATHWEGGAADEFAARWRAHGEHLGDRPDPDAATMAGRLAATAGYADEVAGWFRDARRAIAGTTAEVLGSLEAVRVRNLAGPPDAQTVGAAATIGAILLEAAAHHVRLAEQLDERWAGRLSDLPLRHTAEPVGPRRSGGSTTVAS
jgi:hypothetical protein